MPKKRTSDNQKLVRGTFRADRSWKLPATVSEADIPQMPDYIRANPEATAVWNESLPYAVAFGVIAADTDLLARYCYIESRTRAALLRGEVIRPSLATELRRMAEALGLNGPKSRPSAPVQPTTNPFNRNGRRPQ